MTRTFNLLTEPWLPVRMQSGEVKELGLKALFEQVEQIAALAETAPPALIAQYRLLLAITHRALNSHTQNWRQGDLINWMTQALPIQAIIAYLEQWSERFWLFHPECPFMQVAVLATTAETAKKLKPWTHIDLSSASGNTPVIFSHSFDQTPRAISSSLAVRSLLGFLQCTPGGLVKVFRDADKAGPLANTAAIMPLGKTLAQTLLLGLHPSSPEQTDLPSWERPVLTIADLRTTPILATGPNDRYTRQTRAVLFKREVDGSIRWLHFAVGQGLLEGSDISDPMVGFHATNVGPVRLTLSQRRNIWRDLPALFPDTETSAPILNGAIRLNKVLGRKHLQILVAGLASDQAKLLRWRIELLTLPQIIFEQPNATREARRLLEMAEILFASLKEAAVQLISNTLPNSQYKETRRQALTLFEVGPIPSFFFSHVERALAKILALIEHDSYTANLEWQRALQDAALASWETLLAHQGGSSHLWRANVKAEHHLRLAIKEQLLALNGTGEAQ